MKETDIRKYAEMMKELGLTGLEITEENSKVRLERSISTPVNEITIAEPVAASTPKAAVENKDYTSINSPFVGVYYAAPTENSDPYVSVGDSVKKGQILCIVEAMKLMNEIVASEDGIISEICVTNGQVVEYGTELFRITR